MNPSSTNWHVFIYFYRNFFIYLFKLPFYFFNVSELDSEESVGSGCNVVTPALVITELGRIYISDKHQNITFKYQYYNILTSYAEVDGIM